MLKKALAVLLCTVLAVSLFVACTSDEEREAKDNALRSEIIGVWVPITYDLTTNNPFLAVMFTGDKHYLYSFGGGEAGSRALSIEEGTDYTIKDGYFVIETDTLSEDGSSHEYKTAISFPDRDTMIWGEGGNAETYRRMTDDEIAFFTLPLGYYNPEYFIDENNMSIPMTGGNTTTGGSGSNDFEDAVEKSMKPYLEYYETYVPEETTFATSAPDGEESQ
jgi:hypothetical protein